MCGILGIMRWDDQPISLRHDQILAMRDCMIQRGPDDAGLLQISPQAVLAHRRLAIRDPARGQQPWTSDDGRWSLTYNGEIYNTADLYSLTTEAFPNPPQTRCDTELLLRTIQQQTTQAPSHLRGMFAYGAYDREERRLLLARDRFGIKPLYYAWCGAEFVFASSLAAIRKHPFAPTRLNLRAISHYLVTLRPTLGHETLWEGISLLPPASQLQLDAGGLRITRYWDYPDSPIGMDEHDYLPALHQTLSEAVRCRLVSDVPVGMLLSGGVDSSLLGHYVRKSLGPDFVAEYGMGSRIQQAEELQAARDAAEFLGCRFRAVDVQAEDYRHHWQSLIAETGQPLATPSDVIIKHLARSLKTQVGVVLGGEGADELFGGYTAIHGLGWDLDRRGSTSLTSRALVQQYFAQASLIPFAALPLLFRDYREELQTESLLQFYETQVAADPSSPVTGLTGITRLLHQVNLEALLMRLDQATMSASLEARVPFTDHLLVEQFWNLPAHWRIAADLAAVESGTSAGELEVLGQLESKTLLRQLARQKLPASLANRRKASFPTPVPEWLAGPWKEWAQQMLADSPLIKELFQQQPIGELANAPEQAGLWLWPFLNLALWHEIHG